MYSVINRREIRQARKMRFWRQRITNINKPRLCVFRSSKHIQAQIIDDHKGVVLTCASSIESVFKKEKASGLKVAEQIGSIIAKRAKEVGVCEVVFDRNGFTYHGRIAALANSARQSGLSF